MGTKASLAQPQVSAVLDALHTEARRDRYRFLGLVPRLAVGWLRGKNFFEIVTPAAMGACYISVPAGEGQFLNLTARAIGARTIVEFGTSFGISTIYLACAVKDNGGGVVVGTEIEAGKHAQATANLARAGLSEYADVRLGDALETLRDVPEPVDMVFLDGWKDLYLPVLELLKPKLRRGAVVLADNIHTFKKDLRPYVEYVQSGRNGFVSATLSISDGVEYSYFLGAQP